MEPADPLFAEALERFTGLFQRAAAAEIREPAAMVLATVATDGQPAARVVLLRLFDARGFCFFTNAESRKGQELRQNAKAALCFYWDKLAEQVRAQGIVEPQSEAENDAYWRSRPRESQIGAWASLQSQPLDSRETLVAKVAEYEQTFQGQPIIPRPPHWFGYRLVPHAIEFWSNRPARLHERVLYERADSGTWSKTLLYP